MDPGRAGYINAGTSSGATMTFLRRLQNHPFTGEVRLHFAWTRQSHSTPTTPTIGSTLEWVAEGKHA